MAAPLSPERLIRALDKWKVPYKLYPGWKTRTRPGGCSPIGFIIHHTGGPFTESASYLDFLFNVGRPSERIPGPLCQFAIGPSGTVHVGSVGRANQAGEGSSATRDKIRSENYSGYTSEIRPGPDNINGNGIYWGVEICYPGTVKMRDAQYESAVLLAAAIVDAYGWSALSVLAHREHSRRKGDPYGVNMADFRRAVRARLLAGPSGGEQLPDTGGDWFDMATPAQLRAEVKAAIAEMKLEIQDAAADGVDQSLNGSNVPSKLRTIVSGAVWGAWFGRGENRKTAATVLATVMQQNGTLLGVLTELRAQGKMSEDQIRRMDAAVEVEDVDFEPGEPVEQDA